VTMTFMISYQRSKAESLGLKAKGGLMERAERMILMGVALLATQVFIPVLWLMLVLTTMTAIGRFTRVWQIAASVAPSPAKPMRTHQHTSRLRRGLSRTSRH
jgi:CDP-diacylglycerol--glycerol-3-phosphate 3-phosphatidyltransferase